jgi:two-component system KDP operon response regulator KdpE
MEKGNIRILIVDDEKDIRKTLKVALSSHGYSIYEAVNGNEALEFSVSAHPDVIILDLGLPDIFGIEVVKKIRERSKTPIIILSVREDEADKIAALDAGADDYLTKPFNTGELFARIRAVLRRLLPQNEKDVFEVKGLQVDVSKHSVKVKGAEIRLTPTEYDVLKILVLNAGKVITHGKILKEIWNKTEDIEEAMHLLRVTISNLRSKIEPDPNMPDYVLTEPGVGYRLGQA